MSGQVVDTETGEIVAGTSSELAERASYTSTALHLPEDLTFEQWAEVGGAIQRIARSWQWWLGDWLNYGEKRYGEKYTQAIESTGLDYQTLADAAWVADSVEVSVRTETLSWYHHRVVAPLNPQEQAERLAEAERDGIGYRDLRERIKEPPNIPDVPPAEGSYSTIVIDPPWPVEKIDRQVRPKQDAMDYPSMSLDEIEALPVGDLADPAGCHLYLWTTHKFFPDALRMVEAWGFNYQCLMTWRKNTGISPFSWMYDTEHVVFARKGSLDLLRNGMRLSFEASVVGHSVKPDVFYERVVEASPEPRLEMFARRERGGFTAWGNEVGADAS